MLNFSLISLFYFRLKIIYINDLKKLIASSNFYSANSANLAQLMGKASGQNFKWGGPGTYYKARKKQIKRYDRPYRRGRPCVNQLLEGGRNLSDKGVSL